MIHPAFRYYQKRIMRFYLGKIVPERKQFFMYSVYACQTGCCVLCIWKAHNPFNWSANLLVFIRYTKCSYLYAKQYCSVQFPLSFYLQTFRFVPKINMNIFVIFHHTYRGRTLCTRQIRIHTNSRKFHLY